jgi:hypothetical protein
MDDVDETGASGLGRLPCRLAFGSTMLEVSASRAVTFVERAVRRSEQRCLRAIYIVRVAVDFSLLGEFRVCYDGADLTPSSLKGQALLATLAVRRGQAVAADTLVEELWPALPPDRGRRVLQVRVAEIRKQLATCGSVAAASLESTAGGYRLEVAPEALDSGRFVRLVQTAESSAKRGRLNTAARGARVVARQRLGGCSGESLPGTGGG